MKSDSSRVEFIAIPVVLVLLGILLVLMLAADLGTWAWVVVTVALIVLGIVVIAAFARHRRHPPAFDAPPTTRSRPASASATYRVLVVTDESLEAGAFRDVGAHAGGRPVKAFVVAPALRSRLAHWTGDDSQRDAAETHLTETLGQFENAGIRAQGEVGSDDPIQAADDALRTFEADEVVFVTGSGEGNWLERGVLDLARDRYDIPVTHISSGATGA